MLDVLMLAIKPQPRHERQHDMAWDLRRESTGLEAKGKGMDHVAANRSATAERTDTRYATLAVAALIGVSFIGTTLVTPLYVPYRQVFGFSEITLTLIYAVYVIGNLTALLFFGRLSDQIGRRRTALAAIGVGILSTLVFLFALDTGWLFVARMLSGFAIGIASGTGTAWLAELQGGRDKSRATLMASGANMAGLSVGAVLAGCRITHIEPHQWGLPWACHSNANDSAAESRCARAARDERTGRVSVRRVDGSGWRAAGARRRRVASRGQRVPARGARSVRRALLWQWTQVR
jgi:hypothetical protein